VGQESPDFQYALLLPACFTLLLMLAVLPLGFGITWWSARRTGGTGLS
jgi:hypothetical protein